MQHKALSEEPLPSIPPLPPRSKSEKRKIKIVGISGSIRQGSYCKQVLELALHSCGDCVETAMIDLDTHSLPFRDGLDFQSQHFQQSHSEVVKFRDAVKEATGIICCTPEYHNSYSGILKNALDWLTGNELKGKVVGLICVSSSNEPGTLALSHLNDVFRSLGSWIIPEQAFVPCVHRHFDSSGCIDDLIANKIRIVGASTARFAMLCSTQNKFLTAMQDTLEAKNVGAVDQETAMKKLGKKASQRTQSMELEDITAKVFKSPQSKDKFLIIGGGIAGMKLAYKATSLFQTLVVDSKDYWEYTPGITRSLIQPQRAELLMIPYSRHLKDNFYRGIVNEVHSDHIVVDHKFSIHFDFLVIASGTRYPSSVGGHLKKRFFTKLKEDQLVGGNMKDQGCDAQTRKNDMNKDMEKTKEAKTICVIGGGCVGCQLLGELLTKYPTKQYILIHPYDSLLNNVPASHGSSQIAMDLFRSGGVQMMLGMRASSAVCEKGDSGKKWKITTDSNQTIHADKVFYCCGIIPNSEFMRASFTNVLDSKGFIEVSKTLKVKGTKNIYAIGDITSGTTDLKIASSATEQAKYLISHLEEIKQSREFEEYRPLGPTPLMAITLSPFRGILLFEEKVISTKATAVSATIKYENSMLKEMGQDKELLKKEKEIHKELEKELRETVSAELPSVESSLFGHGGDEDGSPNDIKRANQFLEAQCPAD